MSERGERERFARAVSDKAPRAGDEEFRAELDVVDRLRQVGAETTVDQQMRQDVAARMARKATDWGPPAGTTPEAPAGSTQPDRRRRLRPVVACSLSVAAGLAALAVLCSSGALPGDLLYTVKRTRESAVLAVTLDDRAAAVQRLDYAADRVTELERLTDRSDGRGELSTAYRSGFADFDTSARAAAATLTTLGTNNGDGAVDKLRDWSQQQSRRLRDLRPSLGTPVAHRERSSVRLLDRIVNRATALHERFDCDRITTGSRDSLGPLPASGRCVTSDEQWSGNRTPDRPGTPEPPENSSAPTDPGTTRTPNSHRDRARQASDYDRLETDGTPDRTKTSPAPYSRAGRDQFRPSRTVPADPPTGPPQQPTDSDEGQEPDTPGLVDTLHRLVTDVLPGDSSTPAAG